MFKKSNMGSDKVIVIGSGYAGKTVLKELAEKSIDAILVHPSEAKGMADMKAYMNEVQDSWELSQRYIPTEKRFKCNGRHEYREVREEAKDGIIYTHWICQCGRKIND